MHLEHKNLDEDGALLESMEVTSTDSILSSGPVMLNQNAIQAEQYLILSLPSGNRRMIQLKAGQYVAAFLIANEHCFGICH
jgi:hypothetical protein